MSRPLLEARGLVKRFDDVTAVREADLTIRAGETVALVGESGSGKSTLGRLVTRLIEPDAGTIHFDGADVRAMNARTLRSLRRRVQMVFQDPMASLNPRERIRDVIGRPLRLHRLASGRAEVAAQAAAAMEMVGLDADALSRYPHEFSGGQRQRIGIARALSLKPDLLICDEPVSALDVSIQAQIVNLLARLKDELGIAQLFIAHDLALVRGIADRVAVIYRGRVVEEGPVADVFERPAHPYTAALLAAVPRIGQHRQDGPRAPDAGVADTGCRFAPRCAHRTRRCAEEDPPLGAPVPNRTVACFHPLSVQLVEEAGRGAAERAARIAMFRKALAARTGADDGIR